MTRAGGVRSPTGNMAAPARAVSARRRRRAATSVLALVALALVGATAALAAPTRPLLGTLGPDGTSGSTFAAPSQLAFDQGARRLYVLDRGLLDVPNPSSLHGFDASTPGTLTPLGGSFPLSVGGQGPNWSDDIAVDSASHHIFYLAEANRSLDGFDSTGSALAGFPLALDGDPCGVAVDPSGGLAVGNYADRAVNRYDSSGAPTGSVDTSQQGSPCRVAFASNGDLYVSVFVGTTWRYPAAGGFTDPVLIDSGASRGLAVDRTSDAVYVLHADSVSAYDQAGAHLYDFSGATAGVDYKGIAIDQAADRVYVSNDPFNHAASSVQVFGSPMIPPDVVTGEATAVLATSATLAGTIDPNDTATTYQFEYGPTADYGSSMPATPGVAGAGSAEVPVSVDVSGLTPETTYHYRLNAIAGGGTFHGADRTFRMLGPSIEIGQATDVTTGSAVLRATVDTLGAPAATYRFLVSADRSPLDVATATVPVPGGSGSVPVSAAVSGLPAGTSFTARLALTIGAKTVYSDALAFTTLVAAPTITPSILPTPFPYGCQSPALDRVTKRVRPGARLRVTGSDLGVGGTVTLARRSLFPTSYSSRGFTVAIPKGLGGKTVALRVDCGSRSNAVSIRVRRARTGAHHRPVRRPTARPRPRSG